MYVLFVEVLIFICCWRESDRDIERERERVCVSDHWGGGQCKSNYWGIFVHVQNGVRGPSSIYVSIGSINS